MLKCLESQILLLVTVGHLILKSVITWCSKKFVEKVQVSMKVSVTTGRWNFRWNDPKNVFNADETGLFFKCLPDRILTFKNEKCHGGKLSKERVTLLFAVNMDGSEKLRLLFIGKSAKPRCFKNVKSLPVTYRNNKKSWMTTAPSYVIYRDMILTTVCFLAF